MHQAQQQQRPPAPTQAWQNIIPPANMVRPPPPPVAPAALAPQHVAQAPAPVPRHRTKRRVTEAEEEDTFTMEEDENGVQYAPPEHASMPAMVPLNTVMVGTATSSTLTVPEHPYDREGRRVPIGTLAGRTIFRALLKFGGLTLANIADYHTMGEGPRRRRRR